MSTTGYAVSAHGFFIVFRNRRFFIILSVSYDAFDALIAWLIGIPESFPTGSFKYGRTFPFRQLKESHAGSVGLLFHLPGGKYAVNYFVGIYSNRFRPFAEPVSIPLKVLLMIGRHMAEYGRILSGTPVQPFM